MKAAVLHEVGKPLVIEDVTIAEPGPREILIKTVAVGVCRSDLKFVDGDFPFPLPAVLGHEAAGVVERVGSEVSRLKVGDHVVTCLSAFCGTCEHCVTGHLSLCVEPNLRRDPEAQPRISMNGAPVNQFAHLSAFAEQMLVHENAAVPINPKMPMTRAALIGCAITTGAGAVFNDSEIRPGETIAIIGCGGIGLAAVNAAKIAGAGRIIAIDPVAEKREVAQRVGATDTIDANMPDLAAHILEITGGGLHYVIEAVGQPATVELAWAITKRGGTTTVLGMISPGKTVSIPGPSFLQGKKLQGSMMGSNRFPIDIPRLVDFYMAGDLDLDTIVAEEIGLEDINEAIENLRTGDTLRSVITFS